MPFPDRKLYWSVELPRRLREPLKKQAKKLGFPNVDCLTVAVDNWLSMDENAQKTALDKYSTRV
jgi:adenosyl cobinamide kinase/adenosyl cobinamide phosphate guanylyltransferase